MGNDIYIIWGTGWEAEQFYYQYHNKINILYFVDSFNYGKYFYDCVVKRPELSVLKKGKILIATARYYNEIKKRLSEMGFVECRDFDYCFHVNKKIAIINGNCHCDIIRRYLQTSQKFSQQFGFKEWPLIFQAAEYDEKILEYCDLFIHQDIQKDNSIDYKYSDEYILPKLKDGCIICCIPNLFGFPKALFNKNYTVREKDYVHSNSEIPFPYQEEVIDDCINNGDSFGKIIKKLNEKFVSEKELSIQFEKDREKVLERERYWDIKITDYIYKNWKNIQLFYDVGHPTNILLREIANRVLNFLSIDDCVSERIDTDLSCYEVPVYDCIREFFGLEWNNRYLRRRHVFILGGAEKMDLDEYVREYIWWNYGKMGDIS